MIKKVKIKKYKLIKDYPGCDCDLGTIVQYQNRTYPPYFDIKTGIRYSHEIVEKYPEFWEEIVEKDYEILSFSHSSGLTTLRDSGYYVYEKILPSDCYNGRGATLDEILNNNVEFHDYKIHSVKRLSDGEIFTVNDYIEGYIEKGEIKKIILVKDLSKDVVASFSYEKYRNSIFFCVNNDIGNIPLEQAVKLKEPLFTTEDGVDIYEGDEITFVYKQDLRISGTCLTTDINKKNRIWDGSDGYLQFSTKKAAEEYILMNKPCLSINDINFLKNVCFEYWDKKLKEVVKSKP